MGQYIGAPRIRSVRLGSIALSVLRPGRGTALLALAGLVALGGCRHYGDERYRRVQIDRITRDVSFRDRLWLEPTAGISYFTKSIDFYGRTHVALVRRDASDAQSAQWYDWLTCDTAVRLVYREKYQLLASTAAGEVLAKTTYPYAPAYGTTIDLATVRYEPINNAEQPAVTSAPPSLAALALDDISVVRAFAIPGGTVLASANYSADGALQAIHVDGLPAHTTVRAPNGLEIGIGTSLIDRPGTRAAFGLPERFPVQRYLAGAAAPWTEVGDAATAQLVFLHYARGTLVRRDAFDAKGHVVKRWLRFATTPIDSILAPLDRTRRYGRALVK